MPYGRCFPVISFPDLPVMSKGVITAILRKRKLSRREFECLSQEQSKDTNPDYLAPKGSQLPSV